MLSRRVFREASGGHRVTRVGPPPIWSLYKTHTEGRPREQVVIYEPRMGSQEEPALVTPCLGLQPPDGEMTRLFKPPACRATAPRKRTQWPVTDPQLWSSPAHFPTTSTSVTLSPEEEAPGLTPPGSPTPAPTAGCGSCPRQLGRHSHGRHGRRGVDMLL